MKRGKREAISLHIKHHTKQNKKDEILFIVSIRGQPSPSLQHDYIALTVCMKQMPLPPIAFISFNSPTQFFLGWREGTARWMEVTRLPLQPHVHVLTLSTVVENSKKQGENEKRRSWEMKESKHFHGKPETTKRKQQSKE